MKKNIRFLSLFLMLSLLLSACRKPEKAVGTVLTDQTGREVILSGEAKRVVSCYYVTTYAMLSLGLGDRLVGIEKKAESRPIYGMAAPALHSLPSVGSLKGIDAELIASLSPDLVLLPKKLTESVQVLEALGIPVLIIDPESEENLRGMLKLIAKACGVIERAEKLIAFSDEKTAGFLPEGDRPSVLLCGNSSYLTAAPSGMYQSDLIARAGGRNAFEGTGGNYWTEISYETFFALDPDYIVIPAGASYSAAGLLSDPALSSLRAVKEKKVFSFPGSFEEWDSPVPSGVLGVLWLRAALFPSSYSPESFRKDTVAFYETFYGFTPDEKALAALIR